MQFRAVPCDLNWSDSAERVETGCNLTSCGTCVRDRPPPRPPSSELRLVLAVPWAKTFLATSVGKGQRVQKARSGRHCKESETGRSLRAWGENWPPAIHHRGAETCSDPPGAPNPNIRPDPGLTSAFATTNTSTPHFSNRRKQGPRREWRSPPPPPKALEAETS